MRGTSQFYAKTNNESKLIQLTKRFGNPDIDLFASRINHQIECYAAWKPDPNATFIDAFTVNYWEMFTGVYFPPFCLISRCLQKVLLDQASAIIIVTMWSTQTWFTRLLSLLIDFPVMFPVLKGTLQHPTYGLVHPLSPRLHLLACKISGNSLLTTAFQKILRALSWSHGEQVRRNNMMYTSGNGQSFVIHGRLIPCNRL